MLSNPGGQKHSTEHIRISELGLHTYQNKHCNETACCVISDREDADCSFSYLLNPLLISFSLIAIRL